MADNAAWPMPAASVDANGALVVEGLITIPSPSPAALIVLKKLRMAIELAGRAGAKFSFRDNEVGIDVDGVCGLALNEADLGIFSEIFLEGLYLFNMPGPFFVLDIGANIGMSALFFVRNYSADVRAFELVPSTAELARRNLAMNPTFAPRIAFEEFGLADKDGEFEISADPEFRPSNSLYQAPSTSGVKEKVRVRDVASVFEETLASLGDRKLVVKLDAEGAEYEIIERLAEQKLLERIDLLFLEWHRREGKDREDLRNALRKAGFRWTEREHAEAPVGYITAFR